MPDIVLTCFTVIFIFNSIFVFSRHQARPRPVTSSNSSGLHSTDPTNVAAATLTTTMTTTTAAMEHAPLVGKDFFQKNPSFEDLVGARLTGAVTEGGFVPFKSRMALGGRSLSGSGLAGGRLLQHA